MALLTAPPTTPPATAAGIAMFATFDAFFNPPKTVLPTLCKRDGGSSGSLRVGGSSASLRIGGSSGSLRIGVKYVDATLPSYAGVKYVDATLPSYAGFTIPLPEPGFKYRPKSRDDNTV